MIDHFEIKVRNLQISKDFYTSFLSPLGYKLAFRSSSLLSFVAPNSPHPGEDFWLGDGEQSPIHFAFLAENHEQVQACYEAGLKAGGKRQRCAKLSGEPFIILCSLCLGSRW